MRRKTMLLAGLAPCLLMTVMISPAFSQNAKEKMERFNLDYFCLREDLTHYAKVTGLLDGYLMCMAGVNEDASLCSYARDSKFCQKQFDILHNFYRELILTQSVNSRVVSILMRDQRKPDLKKAREFTKGFLAKDDSTCQRVHDKRDRSVCSALIKRDPSLCRGDKLCTDRVYYLMAMEQGSVKICGKIKDRDHRMLCKGGLTSNPDACKDCEGFRRFVAKYDKTTEEKPEKIINRLKNADKESEDL